MIAEAAAVSAEGVVSPFQARIDHDRYVEGLAGLAKAMEEEGAIPALQIHHAGRQTSSKVIKTEPLAPSPIPCPAIRGDVHPLAVSEIQALVKKFGDAALRARDASFRLLEIHGAHGYLVAQFLSPFSNRRQDEYGGSTENRARFPVEIIQEIRRRIGPEFPVSFKISAQEFVEGGLDVEESIRLLEHIVAAGVDIVQVSAGSDATPEWICQPAFMKEGCLADSAGAVRSALPVPVMAVGRINHPQVARRILEQGNADLVCIGRGLLADPEMPKKAAEGREEDIRICIACNSCMASIFKKGRVECLVNPSLGREKEMEIQPVGQPKKIIVVGGGPAGMNAAWVAAMRGHHVQLFEQGPALGGQLMAAAGVIRHKQGIQKLVAFHKRQIERYQVVCRLNCAGTLNQIRAASPDAVILATGSLPLIPAVPGADGPNAITFRQALDGFGPTQGPVVVVGGGATGCEIALYLAERDLSVTLIEAMPKLAGDLEAMTRKMLVRKLKERGVRLLTETRLVCIEDGSVRVADTQGRESVLPAVPAVLAAGGLPETRLWDELQQEPYEVYRIGDCNTVGTAKEAILEAARIARAL
ncbi:MAG: FAD-dependent oxidoreductase [Desulfobacterales bacterium]|nr:FAD-dependent oxidoreductase [Desulfobacterales bacterium]